MELNRWRKPSTYISYVILTIFALYITFPLFWAFVSSLKTELQIFRIPLEFWPKPPTLSNYGNIFNRGNIFQYMSNSAIVAVSTVFIALCISIPAGYGFAKFKFPGSSLLLVLFVLLRMIPPIMFNIPYFLMMSNANLLNSYIGLILVHLPGAVLMGTWLMQGYFRSVPAEIEEAAEIDGLGVIKRLIMIVLPISLPAVTTVALFNFLGSWNEFMMASTIVRTDQMFTMPVGIRMLSLMQQQRTFWGIIMANAVVYILPVLVVTFLTQKGLIKGITAGAVKA